MAIKKLQNDYTTPEQSKRLLELGVPAGSANFYYARMRHNEFGLPNLIGGDATYTSISTPPYDFIFLPCWSAGRLMEIIDICALGEPFKMWYDDCFYTTENIVGGIEERINDIDFLKLED